MIESWLNSIYVKVSNPYVRVVVRIIAVFLALAGLLTLLSDLGYGQEIQDRRTIVWISLLVISLLLVGLFKLIGGLRSLAVTKRELSAFKAQLREAEQHEQSLLRLMEV